MRLTPRRRAFLAVVVSLPLGYTYLFVTLHLVVNLARESRNDLVACSRGTLHSLDVFNGCGLGASLHAGYVWIELLVVTALALAIGYGLARWVTWPMRQIADSIARFGPTSLGLRLRATGPRDETRRLSDEIDAMLDRLAEGYEAQRRFASNASHELRTPLATQRALIEISLSSALTPEQLELLSRQLLATNERNERLIDGLLTLAETERGLMTSTPRTVSTAKDQLRLALVVAGDPVLTAMMATRSYRIPVEGTIGNTDTLLGSDGFVGMKTGSDDAAGGCFMFRTRRVVDGRTVELVGVVLGQRGPNLITAGLYAAKQLADHVAPQAADGPSAAQAGR